MKAVTLISEQPV